MNEEKKKKELIKIDMNWGGGPDLDYCSVEMYYEEKFVAQIWNDTEKGDVIIDFPARESDESFVLRRLSLETFEYMVELAKKVMRGEAYFDCGVYTEYEKEDSQ